MKAFRGLGRTREHTHKFRAQDAAGNIYQLEFFQEFIEVREATVLVKQPARREIRSPDGWKVTQLHEGRYILHGPSGDVELFALQD